ncbi:similar to Saccharomyces cerevisiae YER038C KRE29 Essential subunit of the Mms21-Smc5-Smc6 complex, required for growth and DNA repair [Maudiozyma saulgeensis]|uniref:Similar to Saccharomyces cerevisiae YER038C KRE29 Essential subunit of the Mms21-Smc5-Smc6 complex, required for growth and DNA repair n=1 Tax=Maudiozyma saulgeensis TaxID=1789683 RepID=A0A1X7RAU7_9SACH|nr:similar to Saccharomyces cerevisiae YER038C KRE29 Essential subunit of the Mms21-Smc5-Smc6 complex, required for growth and DNA repair [Kazachstania saulgeensis]
MTSDEESFHSASADRRSTSLNLSAVVSDSQESSDDESDKIVAFNEGTELSDSTEDDEDDKGKEETGSEGDDLVQPRTKRPRLDRNTTFRVNNQQNPKGFIQVQESKLAGLSEKELSANMLKLNSMQSLIHQSPISKHDSEIQKQLNGRKDLLFKEVIDTKIVKKSLIDVIIHENITNKFQDWHFIRKNCADSLEPGSVSSLMSAIGCEINENDTNFTISDIDLDRYDSYCRIFPVGYMLDHICSSLRQISRDTWIDKPTKHNAVKFFICFILDRNVYESIDINPLICTSIYKGVISHDLLAGDSPDTILKIIDEIFMGLDKKKYFMINRLTTLIPELKNALVSHYFKDDINNIISKFNTLMDERMYESLLYFVMFIYGSQLLPFKPNETTNQIDALEKNPAHKYFKECIYDMSSNTTSDVEISLIKVLLNLYSMVKS